MWKYVFHMQHIVIWNVFGLLLFCTGTWECGCRNCNYSQNLKLLQSYNVYLYIHKAIHCCHNCHWYLKWIRNTFRIPNANSISICYFHTECGSSDQSWVNLISLILHVWCETFCDVSQLRCLLFAALRTSEGWQINHTQLHCIWAFNNPLGVSI